MTAWPAQVPGLPRATPWDRPVGLLLRHAERPSIAPGESGTELPLTAAGRGAAKAFGAAIAANLRGIFTSPLRRCRETATSICDGARVAPLAVDDRHLGDPGVFVGDAGLAWTNWQDLGHASVVDHLAWSDTPLPGIVPPAQAVRRLLAHMTATLTDAAPGFHLFITHDAILFPTIARTLPAADDRRWWPAFLEAAAVWLDPGGVRFAYREVQHP